MPWCALAVVALCIFYVEAQSLTCDSTTDVCPGTELTCNCTVPSVALTWRLPGPVTIAFTGAESVGSSDTGINGVFFAVVTADTGTEKVTLLKYTANDESLMNQNITCVDSVSGLSNTTTITITIADPPSAPNNVSVQSTTYNSATIQWTEPTDKGGSDITKYTITSSPSTGGDITSYNASSDTLTYNITGLNHTINYTVSVAAINCAGTGDNTSTLVVIEAIVLPPTQVNVCVKKLNGSNSFIISWEAPPFNALAPPVIDYTININGDDKGNSISSPFEYPGDIANGLYDISVSTNNNVGQSEPAMVENISVSDDIFNIEVVNTTSSSITLVCNSNSSDVAVRCDVTLTANEPSYVETLPDQMINENIVFESLSPGTTYTYMATLTGVQNVCYLIESTVKTNGTAIPVTTSTIIAPAATASSSATPTSGGTVPSSTPDTTPAPESGAALIGGVAGGVGGGISLAVIGVIILVVCICVCKKPRSKAEDGLTLSEYKPKKDDPEAYIERDPVPETGQSGPMYQDPNTIERQQAPTGDFYALPEKRSAGSRRQPPAAPTELATYQDPSTIQHETAPTGALYAMPDKKPAGVAKQDDRTYAALDFENGTGSASTSFQSGKPRAPDVLYSEVQPQ